MVKFHYERPSLNRKNELISFLDEFVKYKSAINGSGGMDKIYARDHYGCRICGRSGNQDFLEIDHIKPISKGGKSTYDNLQTLCRRCNKEKGDTYYN